MDIMVETQNDRQGACPPWWHIPSIGERNLVKKYLWETDYSSSPLLFMDTSLPFWSSSVDWNDAKGFSPSHKIEEYQRSDLWYIRCFQNYQSKKKTD
jgi:hypothetical protein